MTIRVLMVCMGNICRSPTAEAVLRHYVRANGLGDQVEIDSAGTHGYHVGEAPDPRTQRERLRAIMICRSCGHARWLIRTSIILT